MNKKKGNKAVKIYGLTLIVIIDCYILNTFHSLVYKSRDWALADVDKFNSRSKLRWCLSCSFRALLLCFLLISFKWQSFNQILWGVFSTPKKDRRSGLWNAYLEYWCIFFISVILQNIALTTKLRRMHTLSLQTVN